MRLFIRRLNLCALGSEDIGIKNSEFVAKTPLSRKLE